MLTTEQNTLPQQSPNARGYDSVLDRLRNPSHSAYRSNLDPGPELDIQHSYNELVGAARLGT